MRALFIVVMCFVAGGCVPLRWTPVNAFLPRNLPRTVADMTEVEARASARAKVPLLREARATAESDGAVTIITVTPPVDPAEWNRIQLDAARKRDLAAARKEAEKP